jgi:hypothetical protein
MMQAIAWKLFPPHYVNKVSSQPAISKGKKC